MLSRARNVGSDVHVVVYAALGAFLWTRAKRRTVSKEELAPTVASGDVIAQDLVVDAGWARRQLLASEPVWATLIAPRLSHRDVWIIDATSASGASQGSCQRLAAGFPATTTENEPFAAGTRRLACAVRCPLVCSPLPVGLPSSRATTVLASLLSASSGPEGPRR